MDALLEKINNLYGLKVHSFEKVTKGFLSENHTLIEDSKKYFLKKYRFSDKEKIEEVHSVKKYFANGRIPVILPLVNKKQSTFFCFNNEYFALFPFVDGKQFERGSLTNTAVVSLGEMLGRIHLLGKNTTLSIKEKFKPWDKEKVLKKIKTIESEINKKAVLNDFDKLALESINTKRQLILTNSRVYKDLNLPSDHLVHGDYLDSNVFFDAEDKVFSVFDFEKAYLAPRMYELFRSLVYSFSTDFNDQDIKKAKLYLSSYLKVYPTKRDELEMGLELYYLKAIHSTWTENEYCIKKNDRVKVFLFSSLQRIKYLSEHLEELKVHLLD